MTGTLSRVIGDGGLKHVRRQIEGPAPSISEGSASWSSASPGYPARTPPLRMSLPLLAQDPSRRDPESPLATDPDRPAGLSVPLAQLPPALAASAIWTAQPPPPSILAVSLPSAHRVEGQSRAKTHKHTALLPHDRGSTDWDTSRAPGSSVAMSPKLFPQLLCAQKTAPLTRRWRGHESLALRRTGHGKRGTQKSISAKAQATATCTTVLPNPDAEWQGEPDEPSPCPPPLCICLAASPEARRVAPPPAPPGTQARAAPCPLMGHIGRLYGRSRHLGFQMLPVPAPRPSSPRRLLWAACDPSRGRLHSPASHESVRGLLGRLCRRRPRRNAHTSVRAFLRDALNGCHLWPSWRWISRSAATRRNGSNLATGVCSIPP